MFFQIGDQEHACIFDAKWSPSYDMFASVDSHGYLTLFGFGKSEDYKRITNEDNLLFNTYLNRDLIKPLELEILEKVKERLNTFYAQENNLFYYYKKNL